MRFNHLSLLSIAVLGVSLSGCAAGGGNQSGAARPLFGGLPFIQPRTTVIPKASGPIVRPGPGPALPDARGQKWPLLRPDSAGFRDQHRQPGRMPAVTPRPTPGAPIAREPAPAILSGGIEIVPGPSIRARRSELEMLPSPQSDSSKTKREVQSAPVGTRFEELPPPE